MNTPATQSQINVQTPGPCESIVPPSSCLTSRHIIGPNGEPVASVGLGNGYSCGTFTDVANARLLAASYTLLDRTGRELGIDAATLAERLDLAGLIRAAGDALAYIDQQPDAPQGSIAEVAQCGVRYGLRKALATIRHPAK